MIGHIAAKLECLSQLSLLLQVVKEKFRVVCISQKGKNIRLGVTGM